MLKKYFLPGGMLFAVILSIFFPETWIENKRFKIEYLHRKKRR